MDSVLTVFLFLLTCFSFNTVSSSASSLSYKDHCSSIVPESIPNKLKLKLSSYPLGLLHTGYYTGGDRILATAGSSWHQNSFSFQTKNIYSTDADGFFKIEGTVSFRISNLYRYGRNYSYGYQYRYRRGSNSVSIKLDGFWSESSGKLCMVGKGRGYSQGGDFLHLEAVLKLNNVVNSSNVTSLVTGSLESLSSADDMSYFEPVSVLMLPRKNYEYSLDSKEAENDFSSAGSDADAEEGLSLDSSSFCSAHVSRAIRRLNLLYSDDCNSAKNCTPISGINGSLPSLLSLKDIDCAHTKKPRLRVLVGFPDDYYYYGSSQNVSADAILVGEGWWDENKNQLCVVACHFLGVISSLANAHVGDCSIRLRLRFPSVWSIQNTSTIVGQIWTNKTVNDSGYFNKITVRNYGDFTYFNNKVGLQGFKYEYTQLERARNSCPRHQPVKNQEKRYPDAYSDYMRFDMSVRDSNKRVAWGYSAPLTVDDQLYKLNQYSTFDSYSRDSILDPLEDPGNRTLFNVSYEISINLFSSLKLDDRNSLFNKSSWRVRVSAEGFYDAETGNLCMVGCRNLASKNKGIPTVDSMDCEILIKFQFPPLDAKKGRYIKGSIESTRKISDPLYFKGLNLSSSAYYTQAKDTAWRMDMEIIMVLVSTTLACAFVGSQLFHVKKHPNVLPSVSLIMLSILTLGYMAPLVLNFEALFTQNPNNKNFVLGYVGWLEVNETTVRLFTMVVFLLQFRLLWLTWAARKTDGTQKIFWVTEKKAVCVTLPLYAAGFLIALLVKLEKKNMGGGEVFITSYGYPGASQHTTSWEGLKHYGGLVLDGFLLPQIILNLFSNLKENALSCSFYFGITFVRLLPHAYDLYRAHNYVDQDDGSYYYADPSADFYSTAWDIVIPLGGLLFAVIIFLQQRFGGQCILPRRFKGPEKVYEKVPVVAEAEEAQEEITKI